MKEADGRRATGDGLRAGRELRVCTYSTTQSWNYGTSFCVCGYSCPRLFCYRGAGSSKDDYVHVVVKRRVTWYQSV
jgi:hypothetical protein